MSTAQSLGARIRTLREQKGLTQVVTAVEIGISRTHLTNIERGADVPGRGTLVALADFFGVSLDWLTTGNGNMISSQAQNEKEALLLDAFRRIPEDETDALLVYLLRRAGGARDA
ncbi:hypothetical protein AA103196_2294 [Ameyamaea chiangmaiensis NBRC 103196]|uniref:Helix-turn-helix transcriptional regulator n=1 Tax=Ameyamaea chiangmaiensis TaxID=442969 RepID=A0A850PDB7_9PROT|nr:helix-turn-helix transcriptional regulator [Ameyamaea chiangmaiensis]MBS4075446.1 helix-turn-helix transcriptional regulator [Ameyamaea chiangmaiensis]NVN39021.1 helix-turn-helix transcriptional regulator [Ameyamaea chiangmaiensis]GBQ69732.1 hypothetical protein AA103196_2294 [Ameyamaea chiangmaiensis NBRC 103196]